MLANIQKTVNRSRERLATLIPPKFNTTHENGGRLPSSTDGNLLLMVLLNPARELSSATFVS